MNNHHPPPPPPPPPHGQNPKSSSGLPDGNYDIFIIPPHSSGSGFLYLPALNTHRNSFIAGSFTTLAAVLVYNVVAPQVRRWLDDIKNGGSGGVGLFVMVGIVAAVAWTVGKTQGENMPGMNSGAAPGDGTGQYGHHGQHSQSGPPPQQGAHPGQGGHPGAGPPPQQQQPPPPGAGGAHQYGAADGGTGAKNWGANSGTPGGGTGTANGSAGGAWEKAREETRKREEERRKAEALRKKKEDTEKRAKEQAEKEKWEKERARQREAREREARERIAKEREGREKELREKIAKEAEVAAAAARARAAKSDTAAEAEREKTRARMAKSADDTTPGAKRYEKPTARSYLGTEDEEVYSARPYDSPSPKKPAQTSSQSSFYSDTASSYMSASTARTTPPPSMRGPYTTKSPDKIVIRGVFLFNDQFAKPIAELRSGVGKMTDGLILRITTEGLFIDDDVRGVPQREWDVKAWTMRLVETVDVKAASLHVIRASVRDIDNKKYVFILREEESWKVAVGLQRLKKGSQVRALGSSALALAEARSLLMSLGYM